MTVKKLKITPFQKGLVLGAVAVGALALGAKAVNNNAVEPVGINEVREQGVMEQTITGEVRREKVDPSGKERYIIVTDGGVKYALIGLKQPYGKPEKPMEPPRLDGQANPKVKISPKPWLDRTKVDPGDINAFEDYVGKKVSMTGFVVPVANDKMQRLEKTPQVMENRNVRRPSPRASAKPSVAPKDNGWDYPRFVVKSIKLI